MGRACGDREAGGLYFESATCIPRGPNDETCRPIDFFVLCSPWSIDKAAMMIPDRGVALIDRPDGSGVVDVWDYVGSESYPNVADVIEEGRHKGISRRAPKNGDYSKLDKRSRLILVHDRAIATNVGACYAALEAEEKAYGASHVGVWRCPKGVVEHSVENIWPPTVPKPKPVMCSGLWYESVEGGEFGKNPRGPVRTVERTVGDLCYVARRWFERGDLVDAEPIQWEPGAFLMVPLRFTAILNKDGSPPIESIRAAAKSGLSIDLAES